MKSFEDYSTPQIYPAIDLRGGRCVRLIRGARDAEIHYDDDPLSVAHRWCEEGGRTLHVIDLGAAFGEDDSRASILAIAAAVDVPVQAGGGLREEGPVRELLDGGVARVILGTRALEDPDFLSRLTREYGSERVVVSMDCDGDRVKIAGWEADSPLDIETALKQVGAAGATRFLVTATDRDGTLSGPRLDLIERVLASGAGKIAAAGGIGKLEDVQAVLDVHHPALQGVVVGRALYENTVSLSEAVELTRPE